MIDIEELERLHAAALDWDGDAAAECLNALPGLIAELRALREVIAVLDRDGGHAQEASTPEQTKARALSAIYALREVAEAARAAIGSRFGPIDAPRLRAALAKVPT